MNEQTPKKKNEPIDDFERMRAWYREQEQVGNVRPLHEIMRARHGDNCGCDECISCGCGNCPDLR